MHEKKELYRKLCEQEPSIPLFSQAWWLDAVCGEAAWDVALVEKGGKYWRPCHFCADVERGFGSPRSHG